MQAMIRRTWAVAASAGLAWLLAAPAAAGTTYFNVADGSWTNPASWSAGVPAITNSAAIGSAAGGVKLATCRIGAADTCATTNLLVGSGSATTGRLWQADGLISVETTTAIGDGGYGEVVMTSGTFSNKGAIRLGTTSGSGSSGQLTMTNDAVLYAGNQVTIGYLGGCPGIWRMDGGTATINLASGSWSLQVAGNTGCTGQLVMTSGNLSCQYASANVGIASGQNSTGLFVLAGGTFSNAGTIYVGGYSTSGGGNGEMRVTGGTWIQSSSSKVYVGRDSNNVGRLTIDGAAVTNSGQLMLAQNNRTAQGFMKVQNGAQWYQQGNFFLPDKGSSALMISNGVFNVGPGTATIGLASDTPAGVVQLFGTQRVFRVNTLALYGSGAITNHLVSYAGGLDIANTASTALSVTNLPDRIRLMYDANPVAVGSYWGLRWAGNHTNDLVAYTNSSSPRLSWDTSALHPMYQNKVAIYTNYEAGTLYTYVGIAVAQLPPPLGTLVLFR